jgi:Fe-Mn family superoxide dismutase
MLFSRRAFLSSAAALPVGLMASSGAIAVIGRAMAQPAPDGPHKLAPLPYAANALEPHIDAQTMEIHHGRHHKAYVDNLNRALADQPALAAMPLTELLKRLNEAPDTLRNALRNNGGGHANHTMFWNIMGPNGGAPAGALLAAITKNFESIEKMQAAFNEAGARQFGSGWVFIQGTVGSDKLEIVTRPNQDTPLMEGKPVLIGNDVWEHAYYLKYQNRRADYLKAWWNVVNWAAVAKRYEAIQAGRVEI